MSPKSPPPTPTQPPNPRKIITCRKIRRPAAFYYRDVLEPRNHYHIEYAEYQKHHAQTHHPEYQKQYVHLLAKLRNILRLHLLRCLDIRLLYQIIIPPKVLLRETTPYFPYLAQTRLCLNTLGKFNLNLFRHLPVFARIYRLLQLLYRQINKRLV